MPAPDLVRSQGLLRVDQLWQGEYLVTTRLELFFDGFQRYFLSTAWTIVLLHEPGIKAVLMENVPADRLADLFFLGEGHQADGAIHFAVDFLVNFEFGLLFQELPKKIHRYVLLEQLLSLILSVASPFGLALLVLVNPEQGRYELDDDNQDYQLRQGTAEAGGVLHACFNVVSRHNHLHLLFPQIFDRNVHHSFALIKAAFVEGDIGLRVHFKRIEEVCV